MNRPLANAGVPPAGSLSPTAGGVETPLPGLRPESLSALGHELKSPVTSIRMTLHLMLEEKIGPLNEAQRELVQASVEDCERLLALLQALLEFTRIKSGQETLHRIPCEPAALLASALARKPGLISKERLTVALDGAAELPHVLVDAGRIERVLFELLKNAAQHSTPGSPVSMRLSQPAPDRIRFSLRNRPAAAMPRIDRLFEPFVRKGGDGTGLTLAFCRAVVEAHGGSMGAVEEDGGLAVFVELKTEAAETTASG